MTYQIFPPFSGKIGAILSANKISPPILSASQGKKLPFIEVLLDFFFKKSRFPKAEPWPPFAKGGTLFGDAFSVVKSIPEKLCNFSLMCPNPAFIERLSSYSSSDNWDSSNFCLAFFCCSRTERIISPSILATSSGSSSSA